MKRIQRKRTKGWQMPENTKYVGRPTKWGNPLLLDGDTIYIDASYRRKILSPWVILKENANIDELEYFYKLLWTDMTICGINTLKYIHPDLLYWNEKFKELDLGELKDRNIACWCPSDKWCHADVLIEMCKK